MHDKQRAFSPVKKTCAAFALFTLASAWSVCLGAVIDFEDLTLGSNSFENGAALSGGFTSGGATFNNAYDSTFGSWEGFAYSDVTDVTTQGFTNQYSAYNLPSGGGAGGSGNYAIAYTTTFTLPVAEIQLPAGTRPVSIDLTNDTYSALIMLDGDPNHFARQFGPGDWFTATITGLDQNGNPIAAPPVTFYLADYRGVSGAADYVIDHWTNVDLSSLAGARFLAISTNSSDVGQFGINTPTYVALDNLAVAAVPEPSSLVLAALGMIAMYAVTKRRPRPAR